MTHKYYLINVYNCNLFVHIYEYLKGLYRILYCVTDFCISQICIILNTKGIIMVTMLLTKAISDLTPPPPQQINFLWDYK